MAKRTLLVLLALAVGLAFFNVNAVRAQSILDGKLTGTITEASGIPLPGVAIEITSPALMSGKRATVTSAKGTYVFMNLPVGVYKITATLPGFKTTVQDKVGISAGGSLEVSLTMEPGAIEEQITVLAASPIIDTKSSAIDSKLENQMISRLPTSRDAFYDLSLTTPGMFDHGSNAGWLPSPTAYSGSSNENVFLVNGVNATNPRGSSFGSLVKVNYNAVEEVRVVALGSKAEYGSFSGAAIDVLTKSGSNKFHGNAGVFFQPVKWMTSNQPADTETYDTNFLWVAHNPESPANNLYGGPPKHDYELNATLGGPIVKDRIWFYGGLDYYNSESTRARWSIPIPSWSRYFDMKVTAEPFTKHRAWISYHHENSDYSGGSWGSEPQWDTTMTYGVASQNDTVSAQWQFLPSSTTVFTAKYLGFWTNDTPHVPSDAPANPGYINWWKWASYGINGAFPYIEGWHSNRQTIQADVSHYAEDFLGEHDVKFGAQFTKGRSNSLGGYFQNYANFLYPYRWTQYVSQMQGYGDTGVIFYNYHDAINPFLTVGTSDSLAFFIDDQWNPIRRLTVNLGLRFDRMSAKYGEGYEYEPLSTPSDIANPTVLRVRQGSDNIFDFKTWSPRLGLTYQLTKDAKTIARFSYGRYYMPITVEYLRRYGPDCPLVTRTTQFYNVPFAQADTNGDGFIDTNETREAARVVGGLTPYEVVNYGPEDRFSWRLNTAPGLKDQFTDQFTVSLEREVMKNFSVSGTFIYKHSADLFANIPVLRTDSPSAGYQAGDYWPYDRVPFTDLDGKTVDLYSIKWLDWDGSGGEPNNEDIRWIGNNSDYRVENMSAFDGVMPKRDFQGYQLVFNKRYSNRWQMLGSFLYTHSDGMANRIYSQDMNFEGPMVTDNNWMSTLNYTINNMTGPLPFTPKFEFKMSGSYTIPKIEVDLGARFRMHSGRPLWQLMEIPVRSQWGGAEGSVIGGGIGTIVGSSNPLYYPTQMILDFRVEKAIAISKYGAVHIVVDMFNLFNTNTPTSIDYQWEFGKVGGIVSPRAFRLSFLYQF
jgi:hypothetical protein